MPNPAAPQWKLVIHGGAGVIERGALTADQEREIRAGLQRGLEAGSAPLRFGGSSLDAVEAAVKVLEDDPPFNAGRGAVLTYEGRIELDAAIMDGRTRGAGAVVGVAATRNPVSLARAVMERSPHVMLSREGADRFSVEQHLEQVEAGWFVTPERRRQLQEIKSRGDNWFDAEMKYGTVGAVALDLDGHVAAATSTGGIMGKRWGRIGDAPIIGAGTWADDRSCAASTTGTGEHFLRAAVAHEIAARIRLAGESAQAAAEAALADMAVLGGTGGVIVLTPQGEVAMPFTSRGLYRGLASAPGSEVAIYGKS